MDELAELKARLQRLESAEAIRDLITTYAQGADAGNDVAVLRPLYTDDAVWESPGFGRFEGGDAIANMQQRMAAERLAWTLHYMVSPENQRGSQLGRGQGELVPMATRHAGGWSR